MNQDRKRAELKWRNQLGIVLLGLCLGCRTNVPEKITSMPPFRVMTFNIHHSEGLDRKVDLARIAGCYS